MSSFIFKTPFTCMFAGPTQSGKTTLLIEILKNLEYLVDKPIDRIIYCYSRNQPALNNLSNVEFHEGLPNIDEFNPILNNLIILDDLMDVCEKDKSIKELFTVDSHHKNISIILLNQNLFSQGKNARTISLNCHYLLIFNNPRDRSQIQFLARQMYPTNPNFLIECYEDATKKEYGYLLIDLTQTTNNKLRVLTDILPNQQRVYYIPKNLV